MKNARRACGRRWARRAAVVALATMTALIGAVALAILARPYDQRLLAPAPATSLTLVDRNGQLLRAIPLSGGGRAQWISLQAVPPALIAATLAGEDHNFAGHGGVDVRGVVRAVLLAARAGQPVSGASTITMQLVRLIQPHPRTLVGKAIEMIDAVRLEHAIGKPVILEQYLNRAYYGAGAFGVQQAARQYFGKSAAALSDGEATLLAVLPRSPRRYDPRTSLAVALQRRRHVMDLMLSRGWLTADHRQQILDEPLALVGQRGGAPDTDDDVAPHFCDWVLGQLPPDVRARGGIVRTTLDRALQTRLLSVIEARTATVGGGQQVGVVVIDPVDGAVRAMVGSSSYDDDQAGRVNIVTTPRHPGSTLKPFVYALALEQGASPATRAHDSLAAIPAFHPVRRMHAHGTASYRDALAGSYNIAAVDVLDRVGVGVALDRMRQAGVGRLPGTSDDYGLDLVLGAPRVRLLELAAAYSFLIDGGAVVRPRFLADEPASAAVPVYSPQAAWLTMDVLADAQARRATFGGDLPLDLPFAVAAKTGTSSGFADTIAVAATREAIVAAWAGAFDGSGTRGALAMWTAAPLTRAGLLAVADLRGAPLTLPPPPAGIVSRSVCRTSGLLAGPRCAAHREHFVEGRAPTTVCPGH